MNYYYSNVMRNVKNIKESADTFDIRRSLESNSDVMLIMNVMFITYTYIYYMSIQLGK